MTCPLFSCCSGVAMKTMPAYNLALNAEKKDMGSGYYTQWLGADADNCLNTASITPVSAKSTIQECYDACTEVNECAGVVFKNATAIAIECSLIMAKIEPGDSRRTYFSGVDLVECDDASRPLIVGERTNVIGSRLFKNLINGEQWEEATDIAKRQVRNGAHIIDVCLQSSERDEAKDVGPFYELLIKKIKAPIMIDTTDPAAVELALTYCQGKSIINSVNLEDGEEKFERTINYLGRIANLTSDGQDIAALRDQLLQSRFNGHGLDSSDASWDIDDETLTNAMYGLTQFMGTGTEAGSSMIMARMALSDAMKYDPGSPQR